MIIEKHVCLKGVKIIVTSITVADLKKKKTECNNAYLSKGKIFYGATANEKNISKGARTLYFNEDLKKGYIIKKNNLKRCRPGFGLKIYYLKKIINKKLKKNVKRGDPVYLSHFVK